jgi:hypothetical protein
LEVIARNAFVTTSLSDYVHHLIALRWKAAGLNVAAGFSREPPIHSGPQTTSAATILSI